MPKQSTKERHLSVLAETIAQRRRWERAAKKQKRDVSSWVRVSLDKIADEEGVK
jgi:hypothetical protein